MCVAFNIPLRLVTRYNVILINYRHCRRVIQVEFWIDKFRISKLSSLNLQCQVSGLAFELSALKEAGFDDRTVYGN